MPSFTVSVATEIPAPALDVWEVLLDVARWSGWTDVLVHVTGGVAVGDRPTFHLSPPGGRAYDFRPEVVVHDAPREWSWIARTGGVPGVFDGHHRFVLVELDGDRTRLVHEETYSGLLAPVLRRTLVRPATVAAGFERFDADLRAAVAARDAPPT